MDRLPSISKYCVLRGAGASASSKVGRSEAPSIGCCGTPSTSSGGAMPTASRMVGSRSMAWQNWLRTCPRAAMPFGQCAISGVRTPPSQANRFHRRNGVFPAHAQPQA